MAFDPSLYDDYQPIVRDDERGEISKGLERGARSIGQGVLGTAAAAASAVGADSLEEKALGGYMRQQDKMEQVAPNIASVTDIRSIGDAGDWIASTIAEQAPQLATMFTGAGVGVAVGKKVAKDRVQDQVQALVNDGIPVGEAAKKVADNVLKKYGTAGGAAAGAPINTGLIAGEMAQETGMIDASAVFTGGALVSLIDQMPITKLMGSRTGDAGQGFKDTLKRTLKTAHDQGKLEAGTEVVQTLIEQSTIDYVANNLGQFDEEDISELINAAAAGYLIGDVLELAGSAPQLARAARNDSGEKDTGPAGLLGYDKNANPQGQPTVTPGGPTSAATADQLPINSRTAQNKNSAYFNDDGSPRSYEEVVGEPPPSTAIDGTYIPADAPEVVELGKILDDIDGEVIRRPSPGTLRSDLDNQNKDPRYFNDDGSPKSYEEVVGEPEPTIERAALPAPKTDIPDPEAMKQVATQVNPEPTEAQKEAGNYAKGHVKLLGFDASIENPKGSQRSGVNGKGKKWTSTMQSHYGYLRGTRGADGDHLDIFVGDDTAATDVYVVDQVDPDSREFDEHKVMVGFPDEESARQGYLANYQKDWKGLNHIVKMTADRFKEWAKDQDATSKPAALQEKTNETTGQDRNNTVPDSEPVTTGPAVTNDAAGNSSIEGVAQGTGQVVPTGNAGISQPGTGPLPNDPRDQYDGVIRELDSMPPDEAIAAIVNKPADDVSPESVRALKRALQPLFNEISISERKNVLKDLPKLGLTGPEDITARMDELKKRYLTKPRGFLDIRREYDALGLPRLKGRGQRQKMLDAIAAELKKKPPVAKKADEWFESDGRSDDKRPEKPAETDAGRTNPPENEEAGSDNSSGVSDDLSGAVDKPAVDLPKDNRAIRKQIADREGISPADVTPEQIKDEQEAIELQIVKLARETIESGRKAGKTDPDIYQDLVALYDAQPNLNMRSGDSMARQAYSTPAPLAFAAAVNAGFNPKADTEDNSAGNGMLLTFVETEHAHANELDPDRYDNLSEQGLNTTNLDALKSLDDMIFEQIIVNPPFGRIPEPFEVAGGTMKTIDHAIAARALEQMAPDGKAVLIIGANKRTAEANNKDIEFFKWLYQRYNVTRHHEVEGKLYRKQGAAWPIRVITVDGRRPEIDETILGPNYDTIERYTSWEQIGNELVNPEGIAKRPDSSGIVEYIDGNAAAEAARLLGQSGDKDSGPDGASGNTSTGTSGSVSKPDGKKNGRPDAVSAGNRGADGTNVDDPAGNGASTKGNSAAGGRTRPGARGNNVPASAGVDGVKAKPKPKPKKKQKPASKFTAGDIQRTYDSQSTGMDLGALIPANMQTAAAEFQAKIVAEVGDIDQFVAKELQYKSVEEMQRGLAGLQIDGVAAQIYNSQRGNAIIVADQTGMGKGRQAAAVIRYALKQGKVPIFITEKANLLTDMYDDLQDIGMQADEINPFVMNASAEISKVNPDTNEKTVIVPMANGKKQKAFINGVIKSGTVPDGVNMIFTNYSQLTRDNIQRQAIKSLADKAYFVLDEAHNMAGDSTAGVGKNRRTTGAGFIQGTTKGKPTMYLSATYAKRADNMLAFNNTLLGDIKGLEAELDDDDAKNTDKAEREGRQKMAEALSKGGAPFLASIAHLMTSRGQLIRRERSFEGITVNSVTDTTNKERDLRIDDELSVGFRAIYEADQSFHKNAVKAIRESLKGAAAVRGAGNRASVNHVGFNSVLHNYIGQLLIAKKADAVADQALAAIERGEKPVIGLYNTMESFVENLGGSVGKPFTATFNDILQLALERTRRVSIKQGEKSKPVDIALEDLDAVTQALYYQAMEVIDGLNLTGIPISPIDHIKHRMQQAGVEIGEITGRNLIVDYTGQQPVISQRTAAEKNDRRATIDKFNNNNLDAMLINAAGSTGLSIHASRAFLDEQQSKRRHMIIAQPPPDINTMMQMLGRINRTNQYDGDLNPTYSILSSASPSEKRQTASTLKKLSSLNANTSANTEGSMSFKAVDFLNYYGDIVVAEFFRDNPEFASKIPGATLEYSKELIQKPPEDDFATKMSGRVNAFANAADAEFFYKEVTERYQERVEYEDKMGTNRLSTKLVDLDANIVASTIVDEGDRSNSVVSGATVAHLIDAKSQGKYLKPDDVAQLVDSELKGRTSQEYADQFVSAAITDKQKQALETERAALTEESAKVFGRPIMNKESIDNFKAQDKPHAKKIEAFKKKLAKFYKSRNYRINFNSANIYKTINAWSPGTTVQMEEQTEFKGVVVKYTTAKGSTYAPSSVTAHIATNSQAGVLKVPVSKLPNLYARADFAVEEEFKTSDSRREQRIIYTGNLVNPINNYPGQIVNFNDSKGGEHVGYLLPFWADSDIDVVSQSEFSLKDIDGLLAVLKQQKQLQSSTGASLHFEGTQNIEMRFPKSNMSREVSALKRNWSTITTSGADFYSKPSQNYYSAVARTPDQVQGLMKLAKENQVYFQTSEDNRSAYVEAGGPDRAKPAPSFNVSIKQMRNGKEIARGNETPTISADSVRKWKEAAHSMPDNKKAQDIVDEWARQHSLAPIKVLTTDQFVKSAGSVSSYVQDYIRDMSKDASLYEANVNVIALDPDKINQLDSDDPAEAAMILAHEFGHAVMEAEYYNAPLDVQASIDTDFEEYRDEFADKPESARAARQPEELRDKINTTGDPVYDTDFEEWFADMVANSLLRDLPRKFKSRGFFQKLAAKLRKFIKSVRSRWEMSPGVDTLLEGMTAKFREQSRLAVPVGKPRVRSADFERADPLRLDDQRPTPMAVPVGDPVITPLAPLRKRYANQYPAVVQPEDLGAPIEETPADAPKSPAPPPLDVDPTPGADPVFKSKNAKLQKAINFVLDRGDQFNRWINGTLNRRQIVEGFKHIFPRMTEYLRHSEEMDATRATWQTAGGEIGSRWRELSNANQDEADELASIIHTATIIGADPENFADYTPEFLQAQLNAVKAKTKAKVARTRMFKEVDAATIRNLEQRIADIPDRRAQAKILIARYNAMSPEAKQLYIDSRNYHKQMFNAQTKALIDQIDGQEISKASKMAAIEAIKQMRDDMKISAPYFPLSRFGKYAVSAKKDDEHIYRHFESRADAMRWRQEMEDSDYDTALSKLSEVQSREDTIPPAFVSAITDVINEMGGDQDDSPLVDLKDQIQQMYLAALPELSSRKHEIHRKKVQGFSEDAQRSFAHTAFHGSARLARQRHSWQMKRSLDRMKLEYKIARHPATRKRYVEAAKQLEGVINAVDVDPSVLKATLEQDIATAKNDADREFWRGMLRQLNSDIDINDLLDDYKQLIHNSKFINSDWIQVTVSKPDGSSAKRKSFKNKQEADAYRIKMEAKGYVSSSKRLGDKYVAKGQDALDSLTKSYDWSMVPTSSPIVNIANSTAFVFQLGLTPAAAMVNMTQVVMVSIPMLGGRHGIRSSSDAVFKAGKDFTKGSSGRLARLIKSVMKGKPISEDDIVSVRGNISKEEEAMIAELTRRGTLDRTMAMDLASLSEDGITNSTYIYKAMKVAAFLFHHAERTNREVTALAAYRLEKAKLLKDGEEPGHAHQAATEYASKTTWDSQFDYGSTNRAEYMRKDWQRLFFQYKQYSLSIAYLYVNTFKKAFLDEYQPVGMTAEESKQQVREAKKMFLWLAGLQFAFTGLLGMPLARAAGMIIEGMVRGFTDDDDFDYEHELRGMMYRSLAPILGETMAKNTGLALSKGVFDGYTPVSLHGRLSVSELFFREPDARDEVGEDKFNHYTMQVLGPSIGLLKSMLMGMNTAADGHTWRGVEQAMPKLFKDTMRSVRYAQEGATTKNGDQIVDLNALQVMLNWTGFQPSELSEAYSRISAIYDGDTRNTRKKSALRRRLNKAREAAGENGYLTDKSYTKAMAEIEKYNQTVPEDMQINEKSRNTSWRMYNRRKDKTVDGVYLNTKQKRAIADMTEF